MDNLSLDKEEYSEKAQKVIGEVGIPSQPQVITEINREANKKDANFNDIADIISKDVAMTAKLLKVVNSSFFGLGNKIDSVYRAFSLLGMKNFNNIILSSALKESLGGGNDTAYETFWDHSMATATISLDVAKKTGFENVDQAYLAGLFHDCGVPLLKKRFSDYTGYADDALGVVNKEALTGKTDSVIVTEDKRYATHHCAVGYLIAKSWNVSPTVCSAIWHHHDIDIDTHKDLSVKKLSSILLLADYLGSHILYLRGSNCAVDSEHDWANIHHKALSELDMDVEDVSNLKDDFEDMYMWNEQEKT